MINCQFYYLLYLYDTSTSIDYNYYTLLCNILSGMGLAVKVFSFIFRQCQPVRAWSPLPVCASLPFLLSGIQYSYLSAAPLACVVCSYTDRCVRRVVHSYTSRSCYLVSFGSRVPVLVRAPSRAIEYLRLGSFASCPPSVDRCLSRRWSVSDPVSWYFALQYRRTCRIREGGTAGHILRNSPVG